MNLILLFPEDFLANSQRVRLEGRRQQHVLSIHKAEVGKELMVGLLNGPIGRGLIMKLDSDHLEMDVTWERQPPEPLSVTLILALPRPLVLRRVLMTASSMGVKKIFLIQSYRVEKSFWNSHGLRPEELREALILGLEQAKDTVLPEVILQPRFKPFIEDELPQKIQGTRALVAHPEGGVPCPTGVRTPVTLAVGPEGGFIPFEIQKFLELGFEPVHLGERILKVESAIPALLGRLTAF